MDRQAKIVVVGASGRMGRMLIQTIHENPKTHLLAVTERSGHGWIDQDLGAAMGQAELGVTVTDDTEAALAGADAVIDFTAPAATVALASAAAEVGVPMVIGTTGLKAEHISKIEVAAGTIPIVRAGNMSLGVNLLVGLTRTVAAALDTAFDVEIVEMHHHHKVDAPSGTALMLGEAAAEGRGVDLSEMSDRGRDGDTGARRAGSIGFAALRGGDVVGEHDVIFAGDGERIVLRHVATDRQIFARGAVAAALWTQGKPAGHYSMANVLGLE